MGYNKCSKYHNTPNRVDVKDLTQGRLSVMKKIGGSLSSTYA